MKRIIMRLMLVILGLLPGVSNAFLCNWKDLQCLAWWILPFQQAPIGESVFQSGPDGHHEWAPVSGSVTGSGSRIEIVFQLNQESMNTLSYHPNWYSAQSIVFRKFGLEFDLAERNNGNTLRFDRIDWDDIPSAAGPTRDTDLSDSINKSKNAIGLLIRDASQLQAGVSYKVFVYLKDPLPENGVGVTPYFQIVADTRLLGYAQSAAQGDLLFDAALLGGFTDKLDYFAVQGDGYRNDWKLYRDGRQGLQWASKLPSGAQVVNNPTSPLPGPSTTSAASDPGDRMLGVTRLPTSAGSPQQLPDFIVKKLWAEDVNGTKMKTFYPSQQVKIIGEFKNRGDGNSPSAITVKFYLSDGKKEDSNKQTVGTENIQSYNMGSGDTHTETADFTIPTTPGIYNFTTCADTGNAVSEKHESNNCSDELVIEVVRRSPAEVKRFLNSSFSIIND